MASPLLLETTVPVPLLNGIPVLMHESWHFDSLLLFLPFLHSYSHHSLSPSPSPSPCNGLTLHRWLCVGTSSEVLMGHTHDDQVNQQAGSGGGDRGSWSKVRITGKSQSSMQGHSSSCGMITSGTRFDLQLVHSVSPSMGDTRISAGDDSF